MPFKSYGKPISQIPDFICLVGLPASGKSSFCKLLTEQSTLRWNHINQDKLKTRRKCQEVFINCLKRGERVLVDRCNPEIRNRKEWIDILPDKQAVMSSILYFEVESQTCLERAVKRENHPTLTAEKAPGVIASFKKTMEIPLLASENYYDQLIVLRNLTEAQELIDQWLIAEKSL